MPELDMGKNELLQIQQNIKKTTPAPQGALAPGLDDQRATQTPPKEFIAMLENWTDLTKLQGNENTAHALLAKMNTTFKSASQGGLLCNTYAHIYNNTLGSTSIALVDNGLTQKVIEEIGDKALQAIHKKLSQLKQQLSHQPRKSHWEPPLAPKIWSQQQQHQNYPQTQQHHTLKMSDAVKQALIEKNYNKYDKPYMTLMYEGKKRIWDEPTDETITWIESTYGKNSEKANELLGLQPMTVKEKLLAMLEGARGSDLAKIRQTVDSILYNVNRTEYQKKTLDANGYLKDDKDRKDLIKSLVNENILREQIKIMFNNLENTYIHQWRKTGKRRGSTSHGVKHATDVTSYVAQIAEFVNKNSGKFDNLKFTPKDVELAEYAAMYHDSGRKNHRVDVFDETSSQRARKQLGHLLNEQELQQVIGAIKSKDAPAKNKSPVAILLHEADCIDIIRTRGGDVNKFDFRYMDLYQYLNNKMTSDSNGNAQWTQDAIALNNFAIGIYTKAHKVNENQNAEKPSIVCYKYLLDKISNQNFVYETLGNSVMVYPDFNTLYGLWEKDPDKGHATITKWFKEKKQTGMVEYNKSLDLESGTSVDSFSLYFNSEVSKRASS